MLIDPEAYDASEQAFAASLEGSRPRFVVKQEAVSQSIAAPSVDRPAVSKDADRGSIPVQAIVHGSERSTGELRAAGQAEEAQDGDSQTTFLLPECSHSWRNEVATKLDRYRAKRRPREPHYPSLQLKFNAEEAAWAPPPAAGAPSPVTEVAKEVVSDSSLPVRREATPDVPAAPPNLGEVTARIIPFPRFEGPPPRPLDELAEPVLLAPRILEAPEDPQPQPALGGILIEPVVEETQEKRPGIEVPVQSAPMSRRFLAAAIDLLGVLVALGLFGYVFLRTAGVYPPAPQTVATALLLGAVFWFAYQYCLLVYVGKTPGLMLAKLRLSRFDGSAVSRSLRRWRVLASALSGVSLGLGYAWSILDEDQLCWHDRITETYMAPKSSL